jgi:DNA-binding MarR family transcriptional regulator
MSGPAEVELAPRGAEEERDISLGELVDIAGFALRIAQLTVFERFFALEWPKDLRISEFTVLMAVSRNPGIRQGVLADLLKIKWPNMTKLVRGLEDRGLIERRIPDDNRRSVVLWPTKAGARAMKNQLEEMRRVDRKALDMLDDAEVLQLLRLCQKIAGWSPASEKE